LDEKFLYDHIIQKKYITGLFGDKAAYHEANDNLLIIGLTILCMHHVYTGLYTLYGDSSTEVSRFEFYSKADSLYKESLELYSTFFDHYNKHCTEYKLNHNTLFGLIEDMADQIRYNDALASISLSPHIFNQGADKIPLDVKEGLAIPPYLYITEKGLGHKNLNASDIKHIIFKKPCSVSDIKSVMLKIPSEKFERSPSSKVT
jgi:hypothetical protein